MFTPEATAAAIVGSFGLGCATSHWLHAACFTGSMALMIVPSRSMYAVEPGHARRHAGLLHAWLAGKGWDVFLAAFPKAAAQD